MHVRVHAGDDGLFSSRASRTGLILVAIGRYVSFFLIFDMLAQLTRADAGTRLPTEHLAAHFGVSLNEIRKALAQLELDGRLSREVGRSPLIRAPADISTA